MPGGQPPKKRVTFKNNAGKPPAKNTPKPPAKNTPKPPAKTNNTNSKNAATKKVKTEHGMHSKLIPGEGVLIDVERVLAENPKHYFIKVGNFRIYGKSPTDLIDQAGLVHSKTLTSGDLHLKVKKKTSTPSGDAAPPNQPPPQSATTTYAKYLAQARLKQGAPQLRLTQGGPKTNSSQNVNLYDVLGVSKTATTAEINSAYKRKALSTHPDRPGGSAQQFAKVNEAKAVLLDDKKRKFYDKNGYMALKKANLLGGSRKISSSRKKLKR